MSGDHKRKSRPIAAAQVHTGDGWIEVVIPDVLGKNESHKSGRHLSQATKRLRESVRIGAAVLMEKARRGWPVPTWATSGPWRAEVLGVWPRKRGIIKDNAVGFPDCPVGDVDAPVSQVFDALMKAGILDDDARLVNLRAWNIYRKDVRCTVIRLVRVPDLATRDAEVAHLVARVPASPEPTAKPAPKQRRIKGITKPRKETPCTTTTSN